MDNNNFFSEYKAKQEQYFNSITSDSALLSGWIDDTLEPSVQIMQLQVGLSGLLGLLESKELTRERLKPELLRLLSLSQKLDKIASQNATAQIRLKHADLLLAEKDFDNLPDAKHIAVKWPIEPDKNIPRINI